MKNTFYTLLLVLLAVVNLQAQEEDKTTSEIESEVVVGAIGGTVDVSTLGGAVYTIPIQVPEGINGMQPNLSIVYNSQSGNGLLGWGWNLGGISAITRVGHSIYHDNYIDGVDFDNDAFALDGQRLMVVNGLSDGANGAEYRTEIDNFSKVMSYTQTINQGGGLFGHGSYEMLNNFRVWTSDGLILDYGNTQDSRITYSNGSIDEVALWLLNRVEDRNGNAMTYHYNREGNCYYLSSIEYTANETANLSPKYKIEFLYSNRVDIERAYIGNHEVTQTKLLNCIKVDNIEEAGTEYILWKYDFAYNGGNDANYYEYLKQIAYTCGSEKPGNTIINWGENIPTHFNLKTYEFLNQENGCLYKGTFVGDFNGDGYDDVLTTESYYLENHVSKARILLNKGVGANEKQIFEPIMEFDLGEFISWVYIVDFDGDGLDDFMFSNRQREFDWLGLFDKVSFNIYLTRKEENGTLSFERYETPKDEYIIRKSKLESVIMGDFFGENKKSFIVQFHNEGKGINDSLEEKNCSNDSAAIRTANSYYITYDIGQDNFVQETFCDTLSGDSYYVADYDGDGRDEILHRDTNNGRNSARVVRLSKNNRSGENYYYSEICNESGIDNWIDCFPGDFNGDGHCDALFHFEPDDSDGEWRIYLFKGNAFDRNSYHCNILNSFTGHSFSQNYFTLENFWEQGDFLKVGDFNGDGCADIMLPISRNNRYAFFCYGPVIGNQYYDNYPFSYMIKIDNAYFNSLRHLAIGYFVGKESLQFLNSYSVNNSYIRYISPLSDFYSVKSITDGMKNQTEFEYGYLLPTLTGNHTDDFYTLDDEGSAHDADFFSIPYHTKALKKVTTSNSSQDGNIYPTRSVEYRYKNIINHTKGHGLLGFISTEAKSFINDEIQGTTIQKYSSSELREKRLLSMKSVETYNYDGHLLSNTEYHNSIYKNTRNPIVFALVPKYQLGMHYSLDGQHEFEKQTLITSSFHGDSQNSSSYDNVIHETESWQCSSNYAIPVLFGLTFPELYKYHTHATKTYENDNMNNWIIGREKSNLIEIGEMDIEQSLTVYKQDLTTYSYNSANPFLPVYVIHFPSGTDSPADQLATTTWLEYNDVGQLASKSIWANNHEATTGFKTMYKYSPDHRFLVSETEEFDLNHQNDYTTLYEYDPHYGYKTKTTAPNGLVTKYNQTPLGDSRNVKSADGTFVTTEIRWADRNDPYAPVRSAYYTESVNHNVDASPFGEARTYYDAAGRELRSVTFGLEQQPIFVDTKYNAKGQVEKVSDPHFSWEPEANVKWTSFEYDRYGRTLKSNFPDGTNQEVEYDGLTISTTVNPQQGSPWPSQTTSQTVNVMGWTTKSVDANGTIVNYKYNADGSLMYAQIGEDENTRVSMEYDDAGNRTLLIDPDFGQTSSVFNALGQLTSTENPRMTTTFKYDELGRLVYRQEEGRDGEACTTEWTYDNDNEKGLLKLITHKDEQQSIEEIGYGYDGLRRLQSIKETILGTTYSTSYTYNDNTGRLETTTYPTGFVTKDVYSRSGHLVKICDGKDKALWQTHEKNAYGQIMDYEMGGGTYSARYGYYDDTHLLKSQSVKTSEEILQDIVYHYDDFRNLDARNDNVHGMKETFQYDQLNRLNTITLNGTQTGFIKYDSYGRIEYKEADGRMVFDATGPNSYQDIKPHALREAEVNGNPFNAMQQQITYTMFDKVKAIEQNSKKLAYTYGHDQQRIKAVETDNGNVTREKLYVGNCEFITDPNGSHRLTYLGGPMGVFAVAEEISGNTELHYVMKDHLGSWTALADAYGNVEQEFSYDAWGNSRDPYTWTGTNANRCMFDRGFTGHEMLYDFGLINMNGRCYDPVMSSFLSVDRYVQNPSNSQNFNRYSYCLNNPLRFTDPSGWRCRPTPPKKSNYRDYTFQYLEPRDGAIGSPYMINLFLNGVDFSVGVAGGFGGDVSSNSVSYGYLVNHPQFSAEQQFSLIRNWQKNPCPMNSWMLWYAGLSDINLGEMYWDGTRDTHLNWECDGASHTASIEKEYVGGKGRWAQTVSNIGGDGRYMPPGYDYAGSESAGTSLGGILCGYGGLLMSMESTMQYNQHLGFWRGKNGKYYDFSFHGNQSTGGLNKYAKSLGSKFNNFGRAFGYLGTGISVLQCIDANTIDQKLEYALDATFGFLGATMPEFFGLPSTIWFFGGKQVVNWYNATTITPMIENGINPGLMINQPFK